MDLFAFVLKVRFPLGEIGNHAHAYQYVENGDAHISDDHLTKSCVDKVQPEIQRQCQQSNSSEHLFGKKAYVGFSSIISSGIIR